jgi:serine/threonine protein kinase
MIGQTIAHYQILEKLGEGGMGVVYKARDTHLGRFVAIKVLPPERVADPERKRRFVQEAKAASALNHPNIITIHDIASEGGCDFIVMEYVAGKTLDQLIGRKGLKLNETLKCGIQIADALSKAHAAGIVHRDLKPGNVMVTGDGLVKVLDFGLAKLTEAAAPGEDEPTRTLKPQTEEGTIVGTVAYMSPEQAQGLPVDARSDIFSFGALLYEMVMGRRAFQGETKISTLAAIIKQEPAPLVADTPHDLEKLIARCLRKQPERRMQTMADLKVALEELKEESDSGRLASTRAAPRPAKRKWLWASIAAALLLVAGVSGWLLSSYWRTPTAPLRATPLTTDPGREVEPSLSPDGSQVAFAWNGENQDNFDIYVKLVGPGKLIRLTSDLREDRGPAWSPDGLWIAFTRYLESAKGQVIIIPALGGPERVLCETAGLVRDEGLEFSSLAWSPDSKWVAGSNLSGAPGPGLAAVSVETGERRRLTDAGEDLGPAFSPDGRTLAFVRSIGPVLSDAYLLSLSASLAPQGPPRRLTYEGRHTLSPAWTPDGSEILFTCGGVGSHRGLWRIPASGSTRTAQLVPGACEEAQTVSIARRGTASRLVCTRGSVDVGIWDVELSERGEPASAPRDLLPSTAVEINPALAPDGQRVAFMSDRSGSIEIWACEKDGSNPIQLTSFGRGIPSNLCWSPDGARIAFGYRSEGEPRLYVVNAAGGPPRPLTSGKGVYALPAFSADGRWIYLTRLFGVEPQIWKMPADASREPSRVIQGSGFYAQPSADGRSLYYLKDPFSAELWSVPLNPAGDPAGEPRRVLDSLGPRLDWAVSGRGIFFMPQTKPGEKLSIRFLDFATGQTKHVLWIEKKSPHQGFAASRDGRRLLWTQINHVASDLMLVDNFR